MSKFFWILSIGLLMVGNTAFAVGDGFTVDLSVYTTDTTPPSTPSLLSATPVAQTQINLSWSASTDNVLLSGYQVFRNATQIATTSLTTYSDTGLIASTTYTYFIKAFDSSNNFSSSSNSVATTTLSPVATTTPAVSVNGNNAKNSLELMSFTVTPAIYSAKMDWETTRFAQFELRWGRTSSYELGFVTNELFKREHSTVITELEPGTTYEYELIAYDKDGEKLSLSKGRFTTLNAPDETPPTNVSNLKATVDGTSVALSWDNPKDDDFSYVRIVRSYLFYPTDPYDGYIAYEGAKESFVDKEVFAEKDILYYTVFTYDKNRNISSGAIVFAKKSSDSEIVTEIASSSLNLSFADIEFLQNNALIASENVNVDMPLTVRIPYEKLPEHLKTITVSFTHPDDTESVFSFLLKINKDKTYYEASIAPLPFADRYPVSVSVFDYQTQLLETISGSLFANTFSSEQKFFGIPLSTTNIPFLPKKELLFWLALLLILLYLFSRAVRDLTLGHQQYGILNKTRFVTSVALLLLFGGVCVYLAQSLAQFGGLNIENTGSQASVGALPLGFGSQIEMSVLILVLLGIIAVLGVLLYISNKKDKK